MSRNTTSPVSTVHRFAVGDRDFLLDGKPFVIRCGEIHFPRVPREYWKHRLQMCRALGLNTVCVYLFWNFHEWEEGTFDWTGQADAAEFCRLAAEEGLWVILRPGPYSCAEWEMGGLPWWLTKHDDISLRSTDPRYLEPATRFLHEVGRVLAPLQVTKGGPILMVQVENEYGSFGKDAEYMGALRTTLLEAGFDVPLFACNPVGDLANGFRDDLFQVVNFGSGAGPEAFERLRQVQPTGPLMNGEYYPAWFDMWGRSHRVGPVDPIVSDLDYMLSHKHSFSIYMAHGGTSFGLWAGADRPFSPDTTSYDYDAPVSEAGWVTPKFDAIRGVFSRYLQDGETLTEPPASNPVGEIAPFTLHQSAPLLDNLPPSFRAIDPPTMESYGQSRGAVVYRTTIEPGPERKLTAGSAHDFTWVFLDGKQVGVMDRRGLRYTVTLPATETNAQLDLVVYAMGRVNFGKEVFDRKGLHGPVLLDGTVLQGWDVFPLPLDQEMLSQLRYQTSQGSGPAFWYGTFEVDSPADTFLDLSTWGMGVVWINGKCLGRFWNVGPTQTIYLPAPWLKEGANEVVVLDWVGPTEPSLCGRREPILDELRAHLDFSLPKRATGEFLPTVPVSTGEFTPEMAWQSVPFVETKAGRYLCLEALDAHDGSRSTSASGIDALGLDGAPLAKSKWKVLWVSSEETNYLPGHADHAIDGQTSSYWHTDAGTSVPGHPHRLVIDLGEDVALSGIRYLPLSVPTINSGRIRNFAVYLESTPFGLELPT